MTPSLPDEEALFSEALALPPAARAGFLDRACGENRELRARLTELLAAHAAPEETLGSAAVRPPTEQEEAPGTRIGRYKLRQKIGEGGCGTVHMADQLEPVRRRVALKIIKRGMDTREVITRFEAERQALALMDHPNIAHVLDAGSTDTGRPYFVMELVRGIPITRFCDEQAASTTQRLELFIQVCHAVQHAHQKGIIHRDLKPSNILVTVNDGMPVPKVIDFGIAKATQGRLTDKTVFTAFEQFVGTPAYMSPEQAVMTSLDVDTRSDIYSLGVLLYELLTGRTPFDAKELAQAGLDEIRRRIREMDPPRPSTRLSTMEGDLLTLTARNRQTQPPRLIHLVRGDLDWIVMKCLEKDRSRRYETATSLAQDITRHLHTEPVAARPPSMIYRFRKRVRRHRFAFAAAGAVTLALILGLVGSIWQAVRATTAEHEQIRLRIQAEANEKVALEAKALEASHRREAEAARREAQANAYAAEMNLAHEAYFEGRLTRARSLLENHFPSQSQTQDLRGFEWRHLWRVCHEGDALSTYDPKSSTVVALTFSAGEQLQTYSADGVVRAFDLATGRDTVRLDMEGTLDALGRPADLQNAPTIFSAPINEVAKGLAASANGDVVVAVLANGTVKLWRFAGKWESLTVPVSDNITGVALSRDGRTLAISARGITRLWDCIQQRELFVLPQSRFGAMAVFSHDGSRLAAVVDSVSVRIIDVAERKEVALLEKRHTGVITAIALSPDGQTLATSGYDTSIKLSDLTSGQVTTSLPGSTSISWHLGFSPDGRTLAAAGDGEAAQLWDVSERTVATLKRTLRGHRDKVTALAFSTNGTRLVTASADGTVKAWRIEEPSPNLLQGHSAWAYSVAFSPDSMTLASGSHDGTIRLWEAATGTPIATIRSAPQDIFTVAFTPDGRTLAASEGRWMPSSGAPARRVSLWNVADQREVTSMARDSCFPRGLDISPDGKMLVSGDWEAAVVTLWALPTATEIASFKAHATRLNTVRFSPDGRFLATSIGRGEAKLWDTATRREIARFDCENRSYGPNLDFSLDSKMLAIGWYQIELWSTEHRRLLARLGGHKSPILCVRFSPDGKTLATGGSDHTVKLWNMLILQEVATLRGHTDAVSGLAFSADGTMLASSSMDTTIRLWRAISPAEAAALKK